MPKYFPLMPSLRIVFPVLLLLLSWGCAGCKNQEQEKAYTIGFSQCVGSDLWRKTMLEEMKMELSLHPGTQFIYADADNSSARQVAQVRDMLKKGIDLLIISPNEAMPLAGIVEEVYHRGIPVVVIDRRTSSSVYTAYVGARNEQVGYIAGEYMSHLLGGSGRIMEVMGLPGSSPAMERDKGFREAIARHPGVELAEVLHGDWLPERTREVLLSNQEKLKGIRAIFAHNDAMAASVRLVLRKLKLDSIEVMGVDALPGKGGGLDMVASNTISASMLYPTGGKEAIGLALKILNNQPFEKENFLQTVVIDSSNVQLMKLQWARISSQQADIERQQELLADQFKVYNSQRTVLNVIVIMLVLTVVFGGLAFHALLENRKINRSLEHKNQEILNQRNQLIEMSAKAEAATEAKLSFFTNISHEFRTPLTLILSPLEDLMKQQRLLGAAGREVGLIHKNVYRLLRLVNQLMDYRKIEHKQFKLHASPNDPAAFLSDLLSSFQHLAEKRNIDLKLTVKENPRPLWFDVHMLDKVIFNLLSNALKFTDDHGRIFLRLSQTPDAAIIEVSDNGKGMDAVELDQIFNRFYQSETQYHQGSGLGLSLSRELMLLHRGSIAVRSRKGEGTVFTLSLPLGDAHLTAEEKVTRQGQHFRPYEEMKIYTTALETAVHIEEEQVPGLTKEHALLIVEDQPDLLDYLRRKFEPQYEVFTAESGTDGLAQAFDRVPDLIISDIVIPGISGRELTGRLKSDIRTSHIPVILLTAQGSTEQQVSGLQSRADMYITKPFNFEYLQANVESLIRNRALLKEHYISDVSPAGNKRPAANAIDKKFLNDFAGLVEKNLGNEHFGVEDISRSIGISRVQLYRKVKALLNCSVSDYILSRRLKKARYLLSNEKYSVAEISDQVGIASATYFSTIFKAKYGLSPTMFRKSQQQR